MSATRLLVLALVALIAAACKKGEGSSLPFRTIGRQPDVAPVMLNPVLPFRYPPALYAQKVQGNVTLRIYIDNAGQLVDDSTQIAETSGFSALDSAAIKGSRDLQFEPARTRGAAVPVSILLPVFFRHPDAPALAGDSVIARPATDSAPKIVPVVKPAAVSDTAKKDTVKKDSVAMSPMPAATTKKPTATTRKRATTAKKKTPTRRTTPRRTTTRRPTTR
ncbi:MAG TPA: energy transducer TonB [Gemmatimonadaceae bacterium]|nr:energy transducer TonB [Gemmatimonadaceae bacterium]